MVSVTVGTYQHGAYIGECLDSHPQPTDRFPYEVIIGEEASSDGTRETCIEYAKRYPDVIRLFLHHRENNIEIGGKPTGKFQSTHTRFLPRGRYFSPCDGDDYWTCANKLQLQVDNLEKHPEYSMSAGVVSSVVQKRHSGASIRQEKSGRKRRSRATVLRK